MTNPIKKGTVLINSYRRVRTEQQAAMARLKNARGYLNPRELKELEEIIYFPYDEVINKIEVEISFLCEGYIPVYRDFLQHIEGLGIYDALQLVTIIKDIERFGTVSNLWSYSGFAPILYCKDCRKPYEFKGKYKACSCSDPELAHMSERRIRGVPPTYNEELKKLLINVGTKLIRRDGYYRDKFFNYRDYEYKENPQLTDIHIENRAKRKTIKLFLYHLFVAWYLVKGLNPPKPYKKLPKYTYIWEKEDGVKK
jgi:hypothetical protein